MIKHIYLAIPGNETVNKLSLNMDGYERCSVGLEFNKKVSDITKF